VPTLIVTSLYHVVIPRRYTTSVIDGDIDATDT